MNQKFARSSPTQLFFLVKVNPESESVSPTEVSNQSIARGFPHVAFFLSAQVNLESESFSPTELSNQNFARGPHT